MRWPWAPPAAATSFPCLTRTSSGCIAACSCSGLRGPICGPHFVLYAATGRREEFSRAVTWNSGRTDFRRRRSCHRRRVISITGHAWMLCPQRRRFGGFHPRCLGARSPRSPRRKNVPQNVAGLHYVYRTKVVLGHHTRYARTCCLAAPLRFFPAMPRTFSMSARAGWAGCRRRCPSVHC